LPISILNCEVHGPWFGAPAALSSDVACLYAYLTLLLADYKEPTQKNGLLQLTDMLHFIFSCETTIHTQRRTLCISY